MDVILRNFRLTRHMKAGCQVAADFANLFEPRDRKSLTRTLEPIKKSDAEITIKCHYDDKENIIVELE